MKKKSRLSKSDAEALELVKQAVGLVCVTLPHFSGLAYNLRIQINKNVPSAGIFASGRLVVNPEWITTLTLQEVAFIIAHELMHLALLTHVRASGATPSLFNIAHDYIINDYLRRELQCPVPAGGLDWSGASNCSVEEIVHWLMEEQKKGVKHPNSSWGESNISNTAIRDAMIKSGLINSDDTPLGNLDVLSEETEREWFPGETIEAQKKNQTIIIELAAKANSLKILEEKFKDGSNERGGGSEEYSIEYNTVENIYRPPWEVAVQIWMQDNILSQRSYAHSSRRGTSYADNIVIPGKRRYGYTLHIVLDVSGSQVDVMPYALGKIHSFCEGMEIGQVHIIQCGTHITNDEWVYTPDLINYPIIGTGGGDMRPGLLKLAEDNEVECAIVITDGYEEIPEYPMHYQILWVLTCRNNHFKPSYGNVVFINTESQDYINWCKRL